MSKSDKTKQRILGAAMTEATQRGYAHVTREAIAQRAETSPALVSHYFGTMVTMRRAIMSEAIRARHLRIVAQGLLDKHPKAKRAPDELKAAALAEVMR